jgi:hypothetical protein
MSTEKIDLKSSSPGLCGAEEEGAVVRLGNPSPFVDH